METSTKIGLGTTAVGLAAGAGAGLKIGNARAEKIIDKSKVITTSIGKAVEGKKTVWKELTKDEYIAKKVAKQTDNLVKYQKSRMAKGTFDQKKLSVLVGNIRKDAAEKFEQCCKKPTQAVLDKAQKSKNRWIKGMAVAGLALGALVGLAVKNNINQTTINDGDTIIKISSEKTNKAKKEEAKKKAEAKAEEKAIKQAEKQAKAEAKAEAKAMKAIHKQQEAEAVCEALKSV